MDAAFSCAVCGFMADILDWVSVSLVPGLGATGMARLIERFGGPDMVLRATAQERSLVGGIRSDALQNLCDSGKVRARGEQELSSLTRIGGRAISVEDPHYPFLLSQISGVPHVLYVLGDTGKFEGCSVALVGSRAATSYGHRIAFTLGRDLAGLGVSVVSGLALGVDASAHAGALAAGGETVAVLGCGLDVVYPRENGKLYGQIREHGLLVSEYPLGTRPEAFRFPARNRIIAGMSSAVVVVEAAKKSGSLITAEFALEEGREVFAVPGQVDSFKSAGAHWLLQQGARVALSARAIVDELPGCVHSPEKEADIEESRSVDTTRSDPEAGVLLTLIESYPMQRDQLIARSGLSPARVAELLLMFELDGLIELLPGGDVRRIEQV